MHSASRLVLLPLVTLTLTATAPAQTVTPIPEMKNFQALTGRWLLQDEVRRRPDGPWDNVSWTWESRWIGGRFLEGRFGGGYSGVEIHGYDPRQKTGFYFGVDDTGSQARATWEWTTERARRMDGTTVAADGTEFQWRCTWEFAAGYGSVEGTCERLTNGEWWVYRKAKGTKQ